MLPCNWMTKELHFFLEDRGRDEAEVDSYSVANEQNDFATLWRFVPEHLDNDYTIAYNVSK